jgi:Flp pilus assembly pilin Flp
MSAFAKSLFDLTSIEYGFIAAAVGIAIAVGINILGPAVAFQFFWL